MSEAEPDRRMGGWTGVGYDDIRVGLEIPPYELRIEAADVARFYRCLGEARPAPEIGSRIPSFLLNEIRAMKSGMKLPPGVLHAQEDLEMIGPARLGEALTVSVAISDKYIRNGKRFIVLQQHVQAASDRRSIMKVHRILYWPC
jgi:hypothetical protein